MQYFTLYNKYRETIHLSLFILGMIRFCLVNLQTMPYLLEAKAENVPKRELMQFISLEISQGAIPKLSKGLSQYRNVSWKNILDVGEACLELDPKSRASKT